MFKKIVLGVVLVAICASIPTVALAGFWQNVGTFITGEEPGGSSGSTNLNRTDYYEGDEFYVLGEPSIVEHDFEGMCQDCHGNSDLESGDVELLAGASSVCMGCHEPFERASHPVGVLPSMDIPADMPTPGGSIGCVTCHDPHNDGVNSTYALLRDDGAESFCQRCHEPWGDDAHAGSVNVAHPVRSTPAKNHGELDAMSKNCISCHDGINAPEAMYNLHGDGTMMLNFYERQGSHKLGAVYDYVASGDDWHGKASVDKRISFYEGKMGCMSCHNPYSELPSKLAVEINGSRLCLECHNK